MDYIEVVDQRIYAYHGVLPEEKKLGQEFLVSFKAYLDVRPSAAADDMMKSVSYADMCQTVKKTVTGQVYDLIETLADRTAKALLLTYPLLDRVEVTVKKPSAPVGEPLAYPAVSLERGWHMAYVAVGSNMGDSKATIKSAIDELDGHGLSQVTKVAKVIETEPWGKTDQSTFHNTALEYRTLLSPKELMTLLLATEHHYGRERIEKWGPRTLDLDLIFYDDLISDDPFVTLPHPLMEDRLFVLEPLCEIAPNKVHPLLGTRVFRLCDKLKQS